MYPDLIKRLADRLIAERVKDAERVRPSPTKPPPAAQPLIVAERGDERTLVCDPGRRRATVRSGLHAGRVRSHPCERVSRRR